MHISKIKYALILTAVSVIIGGTAARADTRPVFDDSTVIVVTRPQGVYMSLFSASKTDTAESLEALDFVADAEIMGAMPRNGFSLFSLVSEPQVVLVTLRDSGEENVLDAIERLEKLNEVEFAQPNYYYYLLDTPDDPSYSRQYNLKKVGAPGVWDLMQEYNFDCSGIAVAVIDSGINMEHEDLKDNLWTNPDDSTEDGVNDEGNRYTHGTGKQYIDDVHGWDYVRDDNVPDDELGHGTHVSGIVSAVKGNGIGIASLAGNAKIVPLKVFGNVSVPTSAIYNSVQYVRSKNIPIANMSFGAAGDAANDAVLMLNMQSCTNTVFTVAAGNETVDNDTVPQYPASFDLDNIISVASTDGSDNLSSFSNYGAQTVDIAAPGSAIYSTWTSPSYKDDSGTSMAAPLVASAAAVLKAKYPDLTVSEMIHYLLEGADSVETLDGKINGARRLNVYNSLILAMTDRGDYIPTPSPTALTTPSPSPEPEPSPALTASPSAAPTVAPTEPPEPTSEPTSEPTLEPVPPVPAVSEARLVNDGGTLMFSMTLSDEDAEIYDVSKIKVYAAYKDENGILLHLEKLTLDESLTAALSDAEEYSSYTPQIYVWGSGMKPVFPIITEE